jgi:formylglycine-generating enzyme required for sulfatase activity
MIRRVVAFRRVWAVLCLSIPWATGAGATPLVENVQAGQRDDGSGLVDVYYDLSGGTGPMIVNIVFSNDDGANWNVIPAQSLLSGAVGPGVTNGADRHIIWDAARDRAEVYWPQTRAKITATESGQTTTIMLPGECPLELVLVPGGSFVMGSSNDPPWSQTNEAPPHSVTVNYNFHIGKFEVTQAQWWAVMGTDPSYFKGPNRPVEYVSWTDCQAFIAQLNTLGRGTFRLPSEAEWEYACRGGSTTRWYFGNTEAQLVDYAWYSANAGSVTHNVGLKLPNAFGLYDMSGNVYEWCQDWYHSTYAGAPTDGSAWEVPVGTYRVLRGGNWYNASTACRSAYRYSNTPDSRNSSYGLRLVWTP